MQAPPPFLRDWFVSVERIPVGTGLCDKIYALGNEEVSIRSEALDK